jgi:predicted nucleic acid-binding protein
LVIVFDTYAWIEYFQGSEEAKEVRKHLESGVDIITPFVVMLELSAKSDKEGWDLEKYLSFIKMNSKITGINDIFVLKFGGIYNRAKKKVRGIGIADCIILTIVRLHDAKVLTGDMHFKGFKDVVMLG